MPNRDYYSQISSMDSVHLAKTVLNVLLYSLVELASFIALTQILKKRLNFCTIRQLVFVLDRQMIHVQTAIILWVFYTTQISLEHFGSYNYGHLLVLETITNLLFSRHGLFFRVRMAQEPTPVKSIMRM
ncbi:hypothetical protein P3T76_013482 [Phytophthora citrophthora]|uniref:Uncharacterized protein n=1 Tax=Phytophthora citrophthora TaxID=4793 RepID=A0AAD9LBW0_9STRA|nr:hypothetical protein P3T76_013482 [Phytophthora citrophthora]